MLQRAMLDFLFREGSIELLTLEERERELASARYSCNLASERAGNRRGMRDEESCLMMSKGLDLE